MKITTIGIDLAKEVLIQVSFTAFQIHGVDEHGKAVLRSNCVAVKWRSISSI